MKQSLSNTIIILLIAVSKASSETFTTSANIEELLKIEDILISNLRTYLTNQKNLLQTIRQKIDEYDRVHKNAKMDASTYLANPINAYLITKRLTKDWNDLQDSIFANEADEMLYNVTNDRMEYKNPTGKIFNKVSVALAAFQKKNKLNTTDLVNGNHYGMKIKMTPNDCYQLGVQLYKAKDNEHAAQWLKEALTQLNGTDVRFQIQILEKLSQSYYGEKKYEDALQMTNDILAIMPNHINAIKNKLAYTMTDKQWIN